MRVVGRGSRAVLIVLAAVPMLGGCVDAVGCLVVGCGDPGEQFAPPPLRIAVTSADTSLHVGDVGTATVRMVSGQQAPLHAQWSTAQGDSAVALDPATIASASVRYRAVRSGTARLGVVVVVGSQTVVDASSVVVTVR